MATSPNFWRTTVLRDIQVGYFFHRLLTAYPASLLRVQKLEKSNSNIVSFWSQNLTQILHLQWPSWTRSVLFASLICVDDVVRIRITMVVLVSQFCSIWQQSIDTVTRNIPLVGRCMKLKRAVSTWSIWQSVWTWSWRRFSTTRQKMELLYSSWHQFALKE